MIPVEDWNPTSHYQQYLLLSQPLGGGHLCCKKYIYFLNEANNLYENPINCNIHLCVKDFYYKIFNNLLHTAWSSENNFSCLFSQVE